MHAAGGISIFNSFYRDNEQNPPLVSGATTKVSARIPAGLLPDGTYEASFACMLPNAELFWISRDTWFDVRDIDSYRNRGLTVQRTGLVSVVLPWDNE